MGQSKQSECRRAAWMIQAVLDLSITFAHVTGADNGVPDALSRAHLSAKDYTESEVVGHSLSLIDPCAGRHSQAETLTLSNIFVGALPPYPLSKIPLARVWLLNILISHYIIFLTTYFYIYIYSYFHFKLLLKYYYCHSRLHSPIPI